VTYIAVKPQSLRDHSLPNFQKRDTKNDALEKGGGPFFSAYWYNPVNWPFLTMVEKIFWNLFGIYAESGLVASLNGTSFPNRFLRLISAFKN
jgi:hypothetical protein